MKNNQDEIEFSQIMLYLWEKRWMLILFAFFGTVFGVTTGLIKAPYYKAKTTLYPTETSRSSNMPAALQNIVGNMGMGSFNETQITKLYPEIVRSERILIPMLEKTFTNANTKVVKPLYFWLGYKKITEPVSFEESVNSLRSMISVFENTKTNLFTIEVYSSKPWLASSLVDSLAGQLDEYNRTVRISKAKDNRIFIGQQKELHRDSLNIARNALTEFQKKNMYYSKSPELQAEYSVFSNEVLARSEIYLAVSKQYELAKIEEYKDIPVFNVLDKARTPSIKAGPNRKIIALIGLIFGFGFGIAFIILKEFFNKMQTTIYKSGKKND